jgi:hypothetical protein
MFVLSLAVSLCYPHVYDAVFENLVCPPNCQLSIAKMVIEMMIPQDPQGFLGCVATVYCIQTRDLMTIPIWVSNYHDAGVSYINFRTHEIPWKTSRNALKAH